MFCGGLTLPISPVTLESTVPYVCSKDIFGGIVFACSICTQSKTSHHPPVGLLCPFPTPRRPCLILHSNSSQASVHSYPDHIGPFLLGSSLCSTELHSARETADALETWHSLRYCLRQRSTIHFLSTMSQASGFHLQTQDQATWLICSLPTYLC